MTLELQDHAYLIVGVEKVQKISLFHGNFPGGFFGVVIQCLNRFSACHIDYWRFLLLKRHKIRYTIFILLLRLRSYPAVSCLLFKRFNGVSKSYQVTQQSFVFL